MLILSTFSIQSWILHLCMQWSKLLELSLLSPHNFVPLVLTRLTQPKLFIAVYLSPNSPNLLYTVEPCFSNVMNECYLKCSAIKAVFPIWYGLICSQSPRHAILVPYDRCSRLPRWLLSSEMFYSDRMYWINLMVQNSSEDTCRLCWYQRWTFIHFSLAH